jgi:hypothetical protein
VDSTVAPRGSIGNDEAESNSLAPSITAVIDANVRGPRADSADSMAKESSELAASTWTIVKLLRCSVGLTPSAGRRSSLPALSPSNVESKSSASGGRFGGRILDMASLGLDLV